MADQPGNGPEAARKRPNGAHNGSGGVVVAFPNAELTGAELNGEGNTTQFRYHRESFRRTLAIAAGLTFAVCGLVWLLLGIFGTRQMNLLTLFTGLIFFAFVSARMLARYFRNETILAVQPTGLFDARIADDVMPWESIRELLLIRREQEYSLKIVLWGSKGGEGPQTHEVSLTALEGGAEPVLEAISAYRPVRMER